MQVYQTSMMMTKGANVKQSYARILKTKMERHCLMKTKYTRYRIAIERMHQETLNQSLKLELGIKKMMLLETLSLI